MQTSCKNVAKDMLKGNYATKDTSQAFNCR
jgi:hypothetical protein